MLTSQIEGKKKNRSQLLELVVQAAFRVVCVTDEESWICKKFVPTHNHELGSFAELQLLRSSRVCLDAMAAQLISMKKNRDKNSNIIAHIALQSGGYAKLPC